MGDLIKKTIKVNCKLIWECQNDFPIVTSDMMEFDLKLL